MGRVLLVLRILLGIFSLVGIVSQAITLRRKAKREGWEADGKIVFDAISGAKTDEERKALVKSLSDHVSRMPE